MLILRTLPAAVLALLLLPWRLEAAPPRAPPGNPWVVILGSKPRPAEFQALLDSMLGDYTGLGQEASVPYGTHGGPAPTLRFA